MQVGSGGSGLNTSGRGEHAASLDVTQHLVRAGEGGAERRDLRGVGSVRALVHWSADLERPQHESRRAVLPLDLHTTIS